MHKLVTAFVVLPILAILWSIEALGQGSARTLFTYEQAFGLPRQGAKEPPPAKVLREVPKIVAWTDEHHYLEQRGGNGEGSELVVVNAADGTTSPDPIAGAAKGVLPRGVSLSNAAAATDDRGRAVFEKEKDLYLFDAPTKSFRRLTANPGVETNPRFSPNGRWLAYTREQNLFAFEIDKGVEHQLTSDGSETVSNGRASWVYYEEILGRASRYAAFWWSPDSTRLAFMRFDDSPVPVFPIYSADGQHGELERERYPKAGDPNPWVRMGVVTPGEGKVVWMDFEEKADHYVAWPFWTPDSASLTVQWMNRGQDTIRLYACDPQTGRKMLLREEKQPTWVQFFEDLTYLADGRFLLRSDLDGWDHLYLYDAKGMLDRRLTSGAWRVRSIAALDETGGWVYFTAQRQPTWDTQLMRVRLDGSGLASLTEGAGTHTVRMSPRGTHFIDTSSTVTTPPRMTLHRSDGTLVRALGDARQDAMAQYAWGRAELFTIPSGDGFDLPARWVLPPDFDERQKYPVIISIYGGPDAATVVNQWLPLSAHYWAQRGVIFMTVDHRGSGHHGKKGMAAMHRSLGKWEMQDYIATATWLRAKPFVAGDRIGITGHSYGGYATVMALTFGAEHFNFGQAGAPVTDWHLYDTVYTERYMDTPAENPEGYKNGSVLTFLDRYRAGLRLTHGTIDDNVHLQNTLQVVDWLTSNNRPFELMIYPDSRHRYSQRAHEARESHDFWMRHLLSAQAPGVTATK